MLLVSAGSIVVVIIGTLENQIEALEAKQKEHMVKLEAQQIELEAQLEAQLEVQQIELEAQLEAYQIG
ncbi:hypothetical protein PGT21_018444 [Puccinia graminis f. sp. tritici]|uniref:Uncharacterized protein n=1 Tax=Puccinia graminis f. sp. tritici TaxID=56615 RepID=A0A5B0QFQ8_PUCGR|nr:hypothetical protein PGT21_018444 [Puccinia graminis f. sp. tritici]